MGIHSLDTIEIIDIKFKNDFSFYIFKFDNTYIWCKTQRAPKNNSWKKHILVSSFYLLDSLFLSLKAPTDMFRIHSYKIFYEYLYFLNNKAPVSKRVSYMQLLEVE